MSEHFVDLVDRLTLEDIEVLNYLTSHSSTNRLSAKTRNQLISDIQLNEGKMRKSLTRLEAMYFIEIVTGNRKHLLFVTGYGQEAIQFIHNERGNVNVY